MKVRQPISLSEKKALKMLNKIRKNTQRKGYSEDKIMTLATRAQREVRKGRKKKASRRS